jgi:hypothetical protein
VRLARNALGSASTFQKIIRLKAFLDIIIINIIIVVIKIIYKLCMYGRIDMLVGRFRSTVHSHG